MARIVFLVLAAALLPAGIAQAAGSVPTAGTVQAGVERWRAGDWAGAVAQWQGPATAGDADAMFNLGQAYKLGRGVPADPALAREWYRRAATKGHLPAQTNLGILLFQAGEKPEAIRWLKTAADRGEARAQYVFGIATYNGDGTPRSPGIAYGYLLRASSRGLAQATQALASIEGGLSPADRAAGEAVSARLAAGQGPDAVPGVRVAAPPAARPPATVTAPATTAPPPPTTTAATTTSTTAVPPRAPAPAVRTVQPAIVPPAAAAAVAAKTSAAPTPPANGALANSLPATRPATTTGVTGPAVRTIELPSAAPSSAAPAATPTPAPPTLAPIPRPVLSTPIIANKPAVAPPAAPPKPTGWRVQLGAFSHKAAAEAAWTAMKTDHKDLVKGVTPIYQPAGTVTKLQLGPLKSRDAARDLCARLAFAGRSCFVTPE